MRVRKPKAAEPLAEGDVVMYRVTYHIAEGSIDEAWVGYSVESQVRSGETSKEADERVRKHVEQEVMRRSEDLMG